MIDDERRAASLAVRRQVLGETHVDRTLARKNEFNAEFEDLITRYAWGEIWTRRGPVQHTRRLITLALMVELNRGDEFKMHMRAAIAEGGLTRDDIKEVLLQCAIYCGVPAANQAFRHAQEVFDELARE